MLSAAIPRKTIEYLNLESIDPLDSLSNFIHNMEFKKTGGFIPIKGISTAEISDQLD